MRVLRYLVVRSARAIADTAVTSPLFSWTWASASDAKYLPRLSEFRPADTQTVIEMMDGKYLLASELVDTRGVSPFAVDAGSPAWHRDLHGFGWLRHFKDLRDLGQRRFARTLVLDWIGRNASFDAEVWDPTVTARRVLNWLKSLALVTEDASPEQVRAITRSLSAQVQSLRLRQSLLDDPTERLFAAIALAGAAICADDADDDLAEPVNRLERLLDQQCDTDGWHLSRNPHRQLQIVTELVPVSQALDRHPARTVNPLGPHLDAMHRALERITMGTREPAYFHGCGQVPVDLFLSILAQNTTRGTGSTLSGGYAVLEDGQGKVVADSGRVPPIAHAQDAHASALAFEYSFGTDLIVGNCGPAPHQLPESAVLFRHGAAHSAPTIDDVSAARIGSGSLWGSRLRQRGRDPETTLDAAEHAVEITTYGYADRYNLALTRRLTLVGGGKTLVGQDRFAQAGHRPARQGAAHIRFHLAPGATASRQGEEDLIQIRLQSGQLWAFLWEAAGAHIEESVRHSSYFGLVRTQQIVLTAPARPDGEVAWIFTLQ